MTVSLAAMAVKVVRATDAMPMFSLALAPLVSPPVPASAVPTVSAPLLV